MEDQRFDYFWSNPLQTVYYYSRVAVTVVNVWPGTVSANTSGVQVSDADVFRVLQLFLSKKAR